MRYIENISLSRYQNAQYSYRRSRDISIMVFVQPPSWYIWTGSILGALAARPTSQIDIPYLKTKHFYCERLRERSIPCFKTKHFYVIICMSTDSIFFCVANPIWSCIIAFCLRAKQEKTLKLYTAAISWVISIPRYWTPLSNIEGFPNIAQA